MNEIELMAKIDEAALHPHRLTMDSRMSAREVELANMELERRGCTARFLAGSFTVVTHEQAEDVRAELARRNEGNPP